ncbi:hypothetical protein LWI28_016629 [Acer negundo]|uniref:Uncharacterized protein n=1 Tax=Acer negundo TaxID=4023 RepID=A0AAD5JQI7_ACENE|nr:hypothetical protein LWI28_016629 [Acer negundo]
MIPMDGTLEPSLLGKEMKGKETKTKGKETKEGKGKEQHAKHSLLEGGLSRGVEFKASIVVISLTQLIILRQRSFQGKQKGIPFFDGFSSSHFCSFHTSGYLDNAS